MVQRKLNTFFAVVFSVFLFSNAGYSLGDWKRIGPEGGIINTLAINPAAPEIVYAGTSGGSVFRSTNGGATWIPVGGTFPDSSIVKIIIDPIDPQTIYAATDARVFKSADGGTTWTIQTNGIQWIGKITVMEMDPTNPQILYAGNPELGFFRTTNGGAEWYDLTTSLKSVAALAIDPSAPQTLYGSRYFPSNDVGEVFRSYDGGETWVAPDTGLPNSWWNVGDVRDLLVNPVSGQTIYLASDEGVRRTMDGGTRWFLVSSFANASVLAMDPADPQTLYAGTTDAGIYKSADGGETWMAVNSGLTSLHVLSLAIDRAAPQTIYAGTVAGVFKSVDGGGNWNAANSGLLAAPVTAIAFDPVAPQVIYSGGFDVGLFRSSTGGISWSLANNGLKNISILLMDSNDSQILYARSPQEGILKSTNGGLDWIAANNGMDVPAEFLAFDASGAHTLYAGSSAGGIFKSTDGGTNWTQANSGITAPPSVVVVDPASSQVVYAGTHGNAVFKSTDAGSHWTTVGYIAHGVDLATLLAIDPSSPQTIFAATRKDGLFKSTDGGVHWNRVNEGLGSYAVTALRFASVSHTVYAATSGGGVFQSTDEGATWSALNGSLACLDVSDLNVTRTYTPAIYAATSCGVWMYALPRRSDVTITTNPAGLGFSVDNTYHTTTKTFSWEVGSRHTIYVATPQISGGTRYSFANWSDRGAINHDITVQAFPTTYIASFTTQYRLIAAASPASGGRIEVTPKSVDGYYQTDAIVQLKAVANAGYSFLEWEGDLSGTQNPQTLEMSAPHSANASFELAGVVDISLSPGGAAVASTNGEAVPTRVGYSGTTVHSGSHPYGTAIFSFKKDGVTVSEAGVPASPPTTSARIFIDYRSHVPAIPGRVESGFININTGIALTNYGSQRANVTYTLRDSGGALLATGHGTVQARGHFSCFIDQMKSNGVSDFEFPPDFQNSIRSGSLEIESDQPVSVLALRGTSNQRNDFLLTTTPIAELHQPLDNAWIFFPQFADGAGYTTSLILMNTSGQTETGILQIIDGDGNPLTVTQAEGIAESSFKYSIPANGIFRFQSDGSPSQLKAGWVRLIPDVECYTPVGSGVFGYNPEDVLVSESGIPAATTTTLARIYVDLSDGHNTGLAVANVTNAAANVAISAFQKDGSTAAGSSKGPIQLPANGYKAGFADELISDLPEGFSGVLEIQSETPFTALTLRSLVNERDEFLMTTFPVADLTRPAPSPVNFPRIADGGGFTTQFILISAGEGAAVTLNLYDEDGTPCDFGGL